MQFCFFNRADQGNYIYLNGNFGAVQINFTEVRRRTGHNLAVIFLVGGSIWQGGILLKRQRLVLC